MALASFVDSPISLQVPQNAISSAKGSDINLSASTGSFALGQGRAATSMDPLGFSGDNSTGIAIFIGGMGILLIVAALAGRK